MRFVRYSGTLIPLSLVLVFTLATWQGSRHALTWERPLTYGVTVVAIVMGLEALVSMSRDPRRRYPSLFLITLIYQKIALLVLMFAVLFTSLSTLVEWFTVPEPILFGLLVASCTSIIMVNFLLFFGRRWGLLEMESDPIPLRFLFRRRRR